MWALIDSHNSSLPTAPSIDGMIPRIDSGINVTTAVITSYKISHFNPDSFLCVQCMYACMYFHTLDQRSCPGYICM